MLPIFINWWMCTFCIWLIDPTFIKSKSFVQLSLAILLRQLHQLHFTIMNINSNFSGAKWVVFNLSLFFNISTNNFIYSFVLLVGCSVYRGNFSHSLDLGALRPSKIGILIEPIKTIFINQLLLNLISLSKTPGNKKNSTP